MLVKLKPFFANGLQINESSTNKSKSAINVSKLYEKHIKKNNLMWNRKIDGKMDWCYILREDLRRYVCNLISLVYARYFNIPVKTKVILNAQNSRLLKVEINPKRISITNSYFIFLPRSKISLYCSSRNSHGNSHINDRFNRINLFFRIQITII